MASNDKRNGQTPSQSKESKALEEFKRRIGDLLKPQHDDFYLTKWLKARCFDVNKAEKMFRDSMTFREKMRADKLIEEYTPPKVLQQYLTGGYCGYDKEGSPIRIESYGHLDMRGIMYSTKKSDLEKTKLQQGERVMAECEERAKVQGRRAEDRHDGLTVLFDMENVGTKQMWRPGMQMYLHLVKMMEDNYPEMMKQMYIFNAPRIFPLLWKLGRPLISEDMKRKIHVLGSDYQKEILKVIEPDQLPKYLGGTMTDPDGNPRCITKVCQGGEVPRSFYLSELNDVDDMEIVNVSKGHKTKVDFEVEIPGSLLRWEFRSDDYDIGFGVVFIENGKEHEIVPVKRINAHQLGQDGSVSCEKAGIYAIIFDNRYSWSRDKTIHYLTELHTCDDVTNAEVDTMSDGSWTRLVKGMQITHL